MVRAGGRPEILKLKSSWHRRRQSKNLAVSLRHEKGGGGYRGGGSPPPLRRCTAVLIHPSGGGGVDRGCCREKDFIGGALPHCAPCPLHNAHHSTRHTSGPPAARAMPQQRKSSVSTAPTSDRPSRCGAVLWHASAEVGAPQTHAHRTPPPLRPAHCAVNNGRALQTARLTRTAGRTLPSRGTTRGQGVVRIVRTRLRPRGRQRPKTGPNRGIYGGGRGLS